MKLYLALATLALFGTVAAQEEAVADDSVNFHDDATDDDVAAKDDEAMTLDGFSAEEVAALRESGETMAFQERVFKILLKKSLP